MPTNPKPAQRRAAAHPADRSHIATEARNPRTMALHALTARECAALLIDESAAAHAAVRAAAADVAAFIEAAEPRFCSVSANAKPGRLIYLGAGTSGRLGVLDASECPPTFQIDPSRVIGIIAGGDRSLRKSSEGREDDPNGAAKELTKLKLTANDTILGIAAGGTTPYVLGAMRIAKRLAPRCLTGMLVCANIPKPPRCDRLIVLPTGPEPLTGSTRMNAGTATKIALNTITTTLMVRSGRVYQNLMVDLRATNDKLRDRAARIIAAITGLDRRACFALLDAADGSVKIAAVMHTCAVDADIARGLLAREHGRLEMLLGRVDPKRPKKP